LHHLNFFDLTRSEVPFAPENFGDHPISFADHEAMGFYCQLAEPNHYVFKPYSELRASWGKQYHSWTEWNEKTRDQLENLLANK
jgi:thymidylate synthase